MRAHYLQQNYWLGPSDRRVVCRRSGDSPALDLTCSEPTLPGSFMRVSATIVLSRDETVSLMDLLAEVLADWPALPE